MVVHQRSIQSMENPPQNQQQHDDTAEEGDSQEMVIYGKPDKPIDELEPPTTAHFRGVRQLPPGKLAAETRDPKRAAKVWPGTFETNPDEDSGLGKDEVEIEEDVDEVGIWGKGKGELKLLGEGQLNSRYYLGKGKTKLEITTPGGERRNKKTTGVRIAIAFEDILEAKEMRLTDAAKHLNVSESTLKRACWGYGINRWPPSVEHKKIREEAQLNSGCSGKGKRKEKSPGAERGNNKATGVRIEIPLEDILQAKEMHLEDAAKHLKVSVSTLQRVCREHGIHRWPPRMGKNRINQSGSGPNESLLAVDQEGIPQLLSDMPTPSNTNSVIVKARCERSYNKVSAV